MVRKKQARPEKVFVHTDLREILPTPLPNELPERDILNSHSDSFPIYKTDELHAITEIYFVCSGLATLNVEHIRQLTVNVQDIGTSTTIDLSCRTRKSVEKNVDLVQLRVKEYNTARSFSRLLSSNLWGLAIYRVDSVESLPDKPYVSTSLPTLSASGSRNQSEKPPLSAHSSPQPTASDLINEAKERCCSRLSSTSMLDVVEPRPWQGRKPKGLCITSNYAISQHFSTCLTPLCSASTNLDLSEVTEHVYCLQFGLTQSGIEHAAEVTEPESVTRKEIFQHILRVLLWLLPHAYDLYDIHVRKPGAAAENVTLDSQPPKVECEMNFDTNPHLSLDGVYGLQQVYEAARPTGCEPAHQCRIPGLLPKLRGYQSRAVEWMISRENGAIGEQVVKPTSLSESPLHPLWRDLFTVSGQALYVNILTGEISTTRFLGNQHIDLHGGILCDEMGLGKTVEVLGLILEHQNREPRVQSPLSGQKRKLGELENAAKAAKHKEVGGIRCACGVVERDEKCTRGYVGAWVQCSACSAWSHCACVGIKAAPRGNWFCSFCKMEAATKEVHDTCGATLIVCPAPILLQWYSEVLRHVAPGALRTVVYLGQPQDGGGVRMIADALECEEDEAGAILSSAVVSPASLASAGLVLTTYDVLRQELNRMPDPERAARNLRGCKRYAVLPTPLTRLTWWRVVLDEAQRVGGGVVPAAAMAAKLKSVNRWCVTGTPMVRGLEDLQGLMAFLRVQPWQDRTVWRRVLQAPLEAGALTPRPVMHALLNPARGGLMWRTAKDDVAHELGIPPQHHHITRLKMSAVERHFYSRQHESTLVRVRDALTAPLMREITAALEEERGGEGRRHGAGHLEDGFCEIVSPSPASRPPSPTHEEIRSRAVRAAEARMRAAAQGEQHEAAPSCSGGGDASIVLERQLEMGHSNGQLNEVGKNTDGENVQVETNLRLAVPYEQQETGTSPSGRGDGGTLLERETELGTWNGQAGEVHKKIYTQNVVVSTGPSCSGRASGSAVSGLLLEIPPSDGQPSEHGKVVCTENLASDTYRDLGSVSGSSTPSTSTQNGRRGEIDQQAVEMPRVGAFKADRDSRLPHPVLDRELSVDEGRKLAPLLLRLRQACCHPQIGAGGIRTANNPQRAPMSMEEILDVLISKCRLEAEEGQRQTVAALNGLAGLDLMEGDVRQAVEHYRAALVSADAQPGGVSTDRLQRLHMLDNLDDLLEPNREHVDSTEAAEASGSQPLPDSGGQPGCLEKCNLEGSTVADAAVVPSNRLQHELLVDLTRSACSSMHQYMELGTASEQMVVDDGAVPSTDMGHEGCGIVDLTRPTCSSQQHDGRERPCEGLCTPGSRMVIEGGAGPSASALQEVQLVADVVMHDAGGGSGSAPKRLPREMKLKEEAEKIRCEYLAELKANLEAANQEYVQAQEGAELPGCPAPVWHLQALDFLEQIGTGMEVVEAAKERFAERDRYQRLTTRNATTIGKQFKDVRGLKLVLTTQLDGLSSAGVEVIRKLEDLRQQCEHPSLHIIQLAGRCGVCRAEMGCRGARCEHCHVRELLYAWECHIFRFEVRTTGVQAGLTIQELVDPRHRVERYVGRGGLGEMGILNELTGDAGKQETKISSKKIQVVQAESEAHEVLMIIDKTLKRLEKSLRRPSASSSEASRQLAQVQSLRAESEPHLARLKACRRLWLACGNLCMAQHRLLLGLDELNMATSRLADLAPAEVVVKREELQTDRALGEAALRKALGTLKYLQTLKSAREQDADRRKASARTDDASDVCPVCQDACTTSCAVLPCGHSLCLPCSEGLTRRARGPAGSPVNRRRLNCPVCRAPLRVCDLAYANSSSTPPVSEPAAVATSEGVWPMHHLSDIERAEASIHITGSYSTKVVAVVRRIMFLTRAEPECRVLVFSQWRELLDVVYHALGANHVPALLARGRKGMERALARFKSVSQCAVKLETEANPHVAAESDTDTSASHDRTESEGALKAAGQTLQTSGPLRGNARNEAGQGCAADEPRILMLQISQGGAGLNITEANHVVLVEPLINPADQDQAVGRVHRIGQTKETHVHRFIVESSVEENVAALCDIRRGRQLKKTRREFSSPAQHRRPKGDEHLSLRDIATLLDSQWVL